MTSSGAAFAASQKRLEGPCDLEIDYREHPAYGALFTDIGLGLRLRALGRLVPWILFMAAKQSLSGDRLPPLPGQKAAIHGGVAARLALALRHLRFTSSTVLARSAERATSTPPDGPALQEKLTSDGIAVGRIPAEEMAFFQGQVEPTLRELSGQLNSNAARVFEECQRWLDRDSYPQLHAALERSLEQSGALAAASAYLGRNLKLVRLLLQVNVENAVFFRQNPFADANIPESAAHRLHIDTTFGVVKCMIYLSQVADSNGPFCYVLGSHRLPQGRFEGLVRRAVDRSGLAGLDRASRRMFMALPKCLRRKCSFGSDCLDNTETAQRLLAAEYRWTSADGNFALFDTLGIHRGAAVRQGERHALFAILG